MRPEGLGGDPTHMTDKAQAVVAKGWQGVCPTAPAGWPSPSEEGRSTWVPRRRLTDRQIARQGWLEGLGWGQASAGAHEGLSSSGSQWARRTLSAGTTQDIRQPWGDNTEGTEVTEAQHGGARTGWGWPGVARCPWELGPGTPSRCPGRAPRRGTLVCG